MANMVSAARALLEERSAELITIREVADASGHHHRFVQAWFGGKVGLFRAVFDQMVEEAAMDRSALLERSSLQPRTRALIQLLNWLVATDPDQFDTGRDTPLVDRFADSYSELGFDERTARLLAVRLVATTLSLVLFEGVLGVTDSDLADHMGLEREMVAALLSVRASGG